MKTSKEKWLFIVSQQARFSADMDRMREVQASTEKVLTQTGEVVNRLAHATLVGFKDVNAKIDALINSHIGMEDRQKELDKRFAALAEAQTRSDEKFAAWQTSSEQKFATLAEAQTKSDEKLGVLADSQKKTDESLRILIGVVNRHLSEGWTES